MEPIKTNFGIDDIFLQKHAAVQKITEVMSFTEKNKETKLVKTASSGIDTNQLITLFSHMLSCLNLKSDVSVQELLNKLSSKEEITKTAKIKTSERKDDIKIVSKSIKDSHYQIDISKDVVTQQGKKIFMVSCYARDAYLGRYLIKRNFFYTANREEAADDAYDEIVLKMNAIKERYYNEVIDVSAISAQFKTILSGVVSEIKSEEDSIATNINR